MKIHSIVIVVVCLLAMASFPVVVNSEEPCTSDVQITKVSMFEHTLRCEQFGSQLVDVGVEIVNVGMSDHNIKCKMAGGQAAPVVVEIKYQHNATITKPFSISIFLDYFTYIDHQNITEDMINEGINRIHFNDVYLNTEIGKHTLDAYVNYDVRTRNYSEFYTTFIGLGTKITPFWKFIWGHVSKFF
jgi:hypothetical protein